MELDTFFKQFNKMQEKSLFKTGVGLGTTIALAACAVAQKQGWVDFTPTPDNNPNSIEISPTMVPFPKIEPLYEKDIKVFLDNCQNCEELGITMETVAGGYFEGDFLFHSKDKNDADYFYLNQGTSFEPLNWESTDSEFALVPKANEGDIYTGLKYFIWNPNVTDDSGNMIVTYQPDGTPNSAQKFILPSNNDIEPRLKRARFVIPKISPESLLPQEVKEKFELAGIDLADMENAKYDKDGLHITLTSGEVIVLTNTDLQKGIYIGQDNVLQYRGEFNDSPIYSYDKESGKWGVERPIKEFPWCKDMHLFEQCVIDVADLQEHGRFAQSTLTEDLFDPTMLKFTPMSPMSVTYGANGMYLIPNIETAPNYKNEATAPFKKDYMFGITTINGVDQYVIQVPYYIEGVAAQDLPVITGVCVVGPGGYRDYNVGEFLNKMNVVPWNISDLGLATQYPNPKTGVNFTLQEVQAIVEEMKVGNFASTNGLVLKFLIADNHGGWYR